MKLTLGQDGGLEEEESSCFFFSGSRCVLSALLRFVDSFIILMVPIHASILRALIVAIRHQTDIAASALCEDSTHLNNLWCRLG